MELKTPGIGLPSAIACTAAVLYFTPLYIDGLAANWEILLFVIGIILLIFEFLVIPGFGIAGISGSILILGALILALVGNVNFDFDFVSAAGPLGRLALQADQATEKGYIGVPSELQEYIGKEGLAATILRPSGKVTIGDRQFDAVALHGYIEKGAGIKVVKYENAQLYVIEIK